MSCKKKKKMIKEKISCKECQGNGFVRGTQTPMTATCIFCNGVGNTNHGSRPITNRVFLDVLKWCEEYIDGKERGWHN